MVVASSLPMPYELSINTNYACNCQYKGIIEKSQMQLLSMSLSSHSLRQDAWSLHVLKSVQGAPCSAPIRYKVFVCRSLLPPNNGHDFSVLKTAATVLIRSYDAFRGQPLVLKMVPAVGIMAFAVWGLAPLMRLSRTFFPHKNDSSWKKSGMHYPVTSYVQPLLLWSGATLICRGLEPIILPSEASQAVMQRLLNFVRSLSTVLAFAYCLSSLIQQTQKFFVETNDCSDARTMGLEFAGKAVYTAVWVAAVSLFVELLGFSTQKWLTAGGLGTVLITLAGREIFTNFLSSVMIHVTRPFVLNEWIQTKIDGYEVSGTVEHVGWWSPTIIRGDDREAVHIPNHKFTVNVVRNLSQKTHWRIKTHFAISHLDVNKINNIVADMRKVLAKNPLVEQQRLHRRVFLDYIDRQNQALLILVSCFVRSSRFEEYLCVKEAVLLDLLRVISHHRARLATPIRTVQKIYRDADLGNIPFSDSIFSRTNAAVNRQVLLIEPVYKINSDDKPKVSSRSTRTNEGKDANIEEAAIMDKTDSEAESTNDTKRENDSTSAPSSDDDSKARVSTRPTPGTKNSLNNIEKQQLNKAVSEDPTGVSSEDLSTSGASAGKPLINFQESGTNKTDIMSATPQGKLTVERSTPTSTSRPTLEDNIVLGVALEGSKRTLPIEEEMVPSPILSDKELTACRNGSNPVGKDKKDDSISASDATN